MSQDQAKPWTFATERKLQQLARITDRPAVIGLVGCGRKKAPTTCAAADLYIGSLFTLAKAYAIARCDDWVILSVLHGTLLPDQLVEPYDLTLAELDRKGEAWAWGMRTANKIISHYQRLGAVEFVGLASALYLTAIAPQLEKRGTLHRPLAHKGIGLQRQWLSQNARGPIVAPRAV